MRPMDGKFTALTPELHAYVVEHGTRPDPVLERVARETAELGGISIMQIAPEQGAFLTLLARAVGARAIVEVGTFTGYSAICLARGLPPDGRLLCCERSDEWAAVAQRNLDAAGLGDRVDVRVGPALATLRGLGDDDGPFDLAFVDADKPGYADYVEALLPRLRRGALLVLDNVLMGGAVLTDPDQESVAAIRDLNARLVGDERFDLAMLGAADGLTFLRVR